MTSRMVVTGANGFLGRHVCRAAADRGFEVIGIGHGDWTETTWRHWGLSAWHELDVSVATLLARGSKPDVLIHCAGSGSVGFSLENPSQDFERTVTTTLAVLEYIRIESPETRLVYPSSAAVYGRATNMPISVHAPLDPISPYGVHKKIAEDLCRSYGRAFGVATSIVRIFSAYGEDLRKQLLWDTCQKVTRGNVSFSGTGNETRDWISAEDVAALLVIAASHSSPNVPAVNGATGIEATTREIVTRLFHALGASGDPEFSGVMRAGDPERFVGDCRDANALGWQPTVTWQQGIDRYAKWFGGVVT